MKQLIEEVFHQCDVIAASEPAGSTRGIASMLQKLSLIYYVDVRNQARLSFWSALGAAVIGTGLFFFAVWYAMHNQSAWIWVVAGGLTQFISAVNFYLYLKIARQFSTFHVCLERMNRFLLANTMCDDLKDSKEQVRGSLIEIIACAPMLTLDPITVASEPSRPPESEGDQARIRPVA